MVRKDGAEVRRERIQQITMRVLSLLHKHEEIPLKKAFATLEYETGLKRETLREYLKIGEETDHFILDIENDKIKKIAEADSDELTKADAKPAWNWDPSRIKWVEAEGSKGKYERSEDVSSLDFKNLVKDLAQNTGNLTREGYFYWLFKNGSIVGRKKRG